MEEVLLNPINAINKDGEWVRWYCYGSYAMDVDKINKVKNNLD